MRTVLPGHVFLLAVLVVTCAGAVAQPVEPADRHSFEERIMGTLFRITVAGDRPAAEQAARAAFRKARELDEKLSDYKPESELMKLCARAGTGPVIVSAELYEVLDHSQRLAAQSDGAFDITIGPVVRLWRLARRTRELPNADELKAALAKTGYRKVALDPKTKAVTLQVPGMRLDLGGIAKGYAGDAMIRALRDAGCPRAIVAAGGDVVAGDPPPGEAGWKVAIQPLDADDKPEPLTLANSAVSTCGDVEQFVEIAGVRYSHVIDPRTGLGLTERRSVTVTAPRGILADGLDTAAAVLGPERGIALIRQTPGAGGRFARLVGTRWEITRIP
ncbi:MAG: FAD:protein FMN transferase [Gemmataceae bacterium]|nr:FAD:protein FMN transferase [Gemmataceae bacterium]